jgi:hypothetical protein
MAKIHTGILIPFRGRGVEGTAIILDKVEVEPAMEVVSRLNSTQGKQMAILQNVEVSGRGDQSTKSKKDGAVVKGFTPQSIPILFLTRDEARPIHEAINAVTGSLPRARKTGSS